MIPANEIRINNYYKHNPEWSYRNEDNKEFYFKWEDRDWYALGESMLFMENIEPIELTPELCEKFNIPVAILNEINSFDHCLGLYSDGTLVYVIGSYSDDYGGVNYSDVEVKYLHQLQNIHFAVTGEELSISI